MYLFAFLHAIHVIALLYHFENLSFFTFFNAKIHFLHVFGPKYRLDNSFTQIQMTISLESSLGGHTIGATSGIKIEGRFKHFPPSKVKKNEN